VSVIHAFIAAGRLQSPLSHSDLATHGLNSSLQDVGVSRTNSGRFTAAFLSTTPAACPYLIRLPWDGSTDENFSTVAELKDFHFHVFNKLFLTLCLSVRCVWLSVHDALWLFCTNTGMRLSPMLSSSVFLCVLTIVWAKKWWQGGGRPKIWFT